MRTVEMLARVDGLRSGRTPFVLATVVRAERPTSAKPGDCALVLADGTIDGFVGGVCAESTVRLESLRLLQAGESGLLRITPRADDVAVEEGVRTVGNPCLSGGTLEIFLEAMIPPALVAVHGEAPVARALVRVGHALDWDVRSGIDVTAPIAPDTAAVVVASHGRDEAAVLRAALKAAVPYVALVASRRRAAGVREELAALGVAAGEIDRIHVPAGLDIGARTAPEIALSVFADIVACRPRVHLPDESEPEAPAAEHVHSTAGPLQVEKDPVCGMEVAVTPVSISARHTDATVYFCGTGCRQAFLDDPGAVPAVTIPALPSDVDGLREALDDVGYLADDALATALFLAFRMGQPILLEGEPGVGKTRAATALAEVLDTPLLRLQCYEGLTASEAIYEWNYPRQLLAIRLAESRGEQLADGDLFSEDYLLARPLLAAIRHPGPRPAVLLVDEIDRADDEFEAFLFEALAESAVTIPELGTRRATVAPVVVLTSNRTRDLHDALKRRCLYHWIGHPGTARIEEIVRRRVPEAAGWLAAQVATSVQRLRGLDLVKPPGVAEAISWASALHVLGVTELDERAAQRTLGAVLKYDEDTRLVLDAGLATVIARA